jgi:uncharacterized protein (DUF58 family)
MVRIPRIHIGAALIYVFGSFVLYLAAVYFGVYFMTLFLVFLFLPILSLLSMLITASTLRYNQDFSNDHPLKGEEVVYSLKIKKEGSLPGAPVTVRLAGSQQGMSLGLSDIDLFPVSNKLFEYSYTVKCPFRGIYTVGLDSLEVRDHFGWVGVPLAVWAQTFYVYPRIITLRSAPFGELQYSFYVPGNSRGQEVDYTLVESLRNYSPGMSVRHMAWKKYASLGEPVLKQYETTSRPGVTIYLDTRREDLGTYETLEAEDASLEVLVALVKFFSERNVPVYVYGDGWRRFEFPRNDPDRFREFHHATIGVFFQSERSPIDVVTSELMDGRLSTRSVIIVSHIIDAEVINMSLPTDRGIQTGAILNLAGRSAAEKQEARGLVAGVRDKGARVQVVRDSESIKEDLES